MNSLIGWNVLVLQPITVGVAEKVVLWANAVVKALFVDSINVSHVSNSRAVEVLLISLN